MAITYYDNLDDVRARGAEIELEASYRNGTDSARQLGSSACRGCRAPISS